MRYTQWSRFFHTCCSATTTSAVARSNGTEAHSRARANVRAFVARSLDSARTRRLARSQPCALLAVAVERGKRRSDINPLLLSRDTSRQPSPRRVRTQRGPAAGALGARPLPFKFYRICFVCNIASLLSRERDFCFRNRRCTQLCTGPPLAKHVNDPSAGSPTETLLRLLLPLNDQVWSSSRQHRQCRSIAAHQSEDLTKSFNR